MFGSTADAFRLAKRHFNDIKRKLPRDIAFHEIPFDAVLRTTVRVLSSHPAFSVDEGSRAVLRLRLQEDGLHPYERYEIGHRFFLERVVSHLKAELKGKGILLTVGYSHPIYFEAPDEIKLEVPVPTQIKIFGIDKELVGLVAAKIRSFRSPEPYKGKGIKYSDEVIIRKAGKTAGK